RIPVGTDCVVMSGWRHFAEGRESRIGEVVELVRLDRDVVAGLGHHPSDVVRRRLVTWFAGVARRMPVRARILVRDLLERLHVFPGVVLLDAGQELARGVVYLGSH